MNAASNATANKPLKTDVQGALEDAPQVSILGCGWLGLPLGQALAGAGYRVRGSSPSPENLSKLEAAGVAPYRLELTPTLAGDPADFFDCQVLIITLPPKRRSDDVLTRYPAEVEQVLQHAPKSCHIIFTSSTSVYANLNRDVSEDDAGGDVTASGRAILAAEALLHARQSTTLRLAGLYGYDRKPGRFMAGKTASGGGNPVNLVHRDDVIAALLTVIASVGQEGEGGARVFNLAADAHPTRREVYSTFARAQGFAPPDFVAPEQTGYKQVDNSRFKRAFNFSYRYPNPLQEAP